MNQASIQRCQRLMAVDMATLRHMAARWEMTPGQVVAGAYCLCHARQTGVEAYTLGLARDGAVVPVAIDVDLAAPAQVELARMVEALSSSTAPSVGRSFATLLGRADDQDLLDDALALGNTALAIEPGPPLATRHAYRPGAFTAQQMHYRHLQLETFLVDLLTHPDRPVGELSLMSAQERALIDSVNDTAVRFSEDLCVHELFEAVTHCFPERTALSFQGETVTYDALNRLANRLAARLRRLGARPGVFVPILVPRGVELIAAMLAVLKTGAAFVPLSLQYPVQYLGLIVRQSRATLLVTTDADLPGTLGVIPIDPREPSTLASDEADMPRPVGLAPTSTAALIFTSGTTGRPKGVLVRHDTVVNYGQFNVREFGIDGDDLIMQFAPFTFSTAILEITAPLFAGAQLCLVPDAAVLDPRAFYQEMAQVGATILLAPPQYVGYLPVPPTMRIIETGAAECAPEVSAKIVASTRHVNAYGLTEGCVPLVWRGCDGPRPATIPLGRPVANTQVRVLDDGGHECGLYVPGELCVTGLCVSDGYLDDPARTAERFVPDPTGTGTMLRTGDVVRWNGDGDIEYVGRLDNQVKIRGMRVEPEEVERTLVGLPGVTGAAVIARPAPNGDLQLAGFVTPQDADPHQIRRQLYDRLPEHKVPSVVIALPRLPMTVNGKVDKEALKGVSTAPDDQAPLDGPDQELVARAFEQVLGLSGLGPKADFFALGGHSLSAAMAINHVEDLSGVRMALTDLFEHPSVAGFAEALRRRCDQDGIVAADASPVPRTPQAGTYPMSPAQRRVYLTCQAVDVHTAYNIPVALEFAGELDLGRATDALNALVARHAALRTSFRVATDETAGVLAVQDVAAPQDVHIDVETVELREQDTAESLVADFARPFDLAVAPLMRARAAIAPARSVLLVDVHHIVADGRSLALLLDEFCKLYDGEPLTPDPHQYPDFCQWAGARDLTAQRDRWVARFTPPPAPLGLITDAPRPPLPSFVGGQTERVLDAGLRDRIDALARQAEATPFMVLASTLMAVLAAHAGQADVTLGVPVAGRPRRQFEDVVGMFVNTVVLRGQADPDLTFAQFLRAMGLACLDAFADQDYPYEELVDALGLARDPSRNPLFDVSFTFQNNDVVQARLDGLTFVDSARPPLPAQFDLAFEVIPDQGGYRVRLAHRVPLFDADSAQTLLRHYVAALRAVVDDPSVTLRDLPLADDEEHELVLHEFSGAQATQAEPRPTFAEMVAEQARRRPDHVALSLPGRAMTYAELDERADDVAAWLAEAGVGRGDLVAVRCGRGFDYVVGVLGTLKAGAGFLAIDEATPAQRRRFLLDDSGAKALLVCGAAASEPVGDLPRCDLGALAPRPDRTPLGIEPAGPHDLAYCVYTSGSTGTPKGALVEQASLSNLAGLRDQLGVSACDTLLQFASCAFDVSVWELFAALSSGATLRLLAPDAAHDPEAVREALADCTVAFLPPGYVPLVRPAGLRLLITAGSEALPETVRHGDSNAAYVNAYGPTEATVFATVWTHRPGEAVPARVPIGRPVPGALARVLDGTRACPVGVPGQLCLGGAGVARGYLNRPELTDEKFVDDPFGAGRLYRTGDIVRWRPDGQIEYLGRSDDQVKIRGFRVEPGEVESALLGLAQVREAAVVAVAGETDGPELVAYVSVDADDVDTARMRTQLAGLLPDYMLPKSIVVLDELPRGVAGKIDRTRLPAPCAPARRADPEAPRTRDEALLAWVVGEVLDIGPVGIQENFFALGGNSLLVIKAINMVESITGVRLPVAAWFAAPTVSALAAVLDARRGQPQQ